jgi:hypothetical protein
MKNPHQNDRRKPRVYKPNFNKLLGPSHRLVGMALVLSDVMLVSRGARKRRAAAA